MSAPLSSNASQAFQRFSLRLDHSMQGSRRGCNDMSLSGDHTIFKQMLSGRALLRRLSLACPTTCDCLPGLSLRGGHLLHSSGDHVALSAAIAMEDGTQDADKSYIDRLKVTARAGGGGHGCVSFWRSSNKGKRVPADGGNGGNGGDVILRATANVRSLAGVQQLYKGEPGAHGSRQKQHGRAGKATVVLVPVGTVVSRLGTQPSSEAMGASEGPARAHMAGVSPLGAAEAGRGQGSWQPSTSSMESDGAGSCGDSSAGGGAQAQRGMPPSSRHLPRMQLPSRKRGRVGVTGRGAGLAGEEEEEGQFRAPREDEIPDWLKRWRQPWVGARDYRSDEDSDLSDLEGSEEGSSGEGEEVGAEGAGAGEGRVGGGSGSSGGLWRDVEGRQLLADLIEDGQEVVVARGGQGGRGNAAFQARPNRPAPKESERGQPGEVAKLLLELKLLADVGLVGLPNAGKSTLLRAISNATPRVDTTELVPSFVVLKSTLLLRAISNGTPKVGSYAFTTLAPQLGVVDRGDGEQGGDSTRIVVADIPGLIAGAHENRGLGHHFLRHIERTRALAYVVDASAGSNGTPGVEPWEALDMLQHEIKEYSHRSAAGLNTRPALVVANKVDLLPRPAVILQQLRRRTDLPVVGVSAREHVGIQELLRELRGVVRDGTLGGMAGEG